MGRVARRLRADRGPRGRQSSLVAAIDGRRSLAEIAAVTGTDPIGMGALWARIERELGDYGLLLYSAILRR